MKQAFFHANAAWPEARYVEPMVGEPYVALTLTGALSIGTQDGNVDLTPCLLGQFLNVEHARQLATSILEKLPPKAQPLEVVR